MNGQPHSPGDNTEGVASELSASLSSQLKGESLLQLLDSHRSILVAETRAMCRGSGAYNNPLLSISTECRIQSLFIIRHSFSIEDSAVSQTQTW